MNATDHRPFSPAPGWAPGRAPGLLFKNADQRLRNADPAKREAPEEADTGDDERLLLCADCRHVITRPSERAEIQGGHKHTFANPYGVFFEIGCFRLAPGCAHAGPLTTEFTWFRGYAWQIAVCGACATHLGWRFLSDSGGNFHGIVLDRLVLSEPGRE